MITLKIFKKTLLPLESLSKWKEKVINKVEFKIGNLQFKGKTISNRISFM